MPTDKPATATSSAKAGASQKPVVSVLRSSGLVACMTFISRILGLLRDVVIAYVFGASNAADAFFVAFKIPNFLRRLFAEGAFNQAFIPVLAEVHQTESQDKLKEMVAYVSGALLIVLLLVTVLAVLVAPWLVWMFAPGFADQPEKLALTGQMLRITFPYILLISMAGLMAGLLNHGGRFAVPAATPIILNICFIAAALWLAPRMAVPIVALAWGVLVAGVLQLTWQLPFVAHMGLLTRPKVDFSNQRVKQVLTLMLPAIFGVSVAQINLLLDTILASLLANGSVSWLYYSDRLMELPLGVFGIAIATVILPTLSLQYAQQDKQRFSATIDWAVRMVLLIGVPAALALWLLAEPLLTSLFHYGAMTETDIHQSAGSLRAYALGLLAFMLIKVLAPGFFARQDVKTPVRIGVMAMAANMVFNLILVWEFAHVGLAMATSLSALVNACVLAVYLFRQGVWQYHQGWLVFLGRLLLACLALVAWILWLAAPVQVWFAMSLLERVAQLSLLVGTGILVYVLVVVICGMRIKHVQGPKPASDN